MARIRSVKPEFWSDRKLARVSRDARLLYIALWNQADEHGRLQGDARWINGHCFPYDDDIGDPDIDRLLQELVRLGRVQRYTVDGDPYLFLPKLADHQRLEPSKSASRLPEPPPVPIGVPATIVPDSAQIVSDDSAPIDAQHVAGSREHVAGFRGGDSRKIAAAPKRGHRLPDDWQPTSAQLDWAQSEAPQLDMHVEAEKFRNHWHAKAGQNATKVDWSATWRNWILNARDRYGGQARASPTSRSAAAYARAQAAEESARVAH